MAYSSGEAVLSLDLGEILFRASDSEEEAAIISIDISHSEQVRRWWPFLRDRRIDEYGEIVKRYGI